jgi:hypothetical protein
LAQLRGGLIKGKRPALQEQPECVRFAVASCHFPSDIFDRMPAEEKAPHGPADASLLALGGLMDTDGSPSLLLLAGDQVYVDATAGLFDPKIRDDRFRIPYENRGASRGAQAAFQRLNVPVEMMIDDHEIHDNWAPNDPDADDICPGKKNYWLYERARPGAQFEDPISYAFEHWGLEFFMGDARTERDGRNVLNWRTARIMGKPQWRCLRAWLIAEQRKNLAKFVLTPSALLPRRLEVARDPSCALHSDAWDGYPFSQHALLRFACDHQLKGLVFLSGDEHISSFTEAKITKMGSNMACTIYSVHSSALYAPYPFANGTAEDYESCERFYFPDPRRGPYECSVKTEFAPGDGFALVETDRHVRGCELRVEFRSADGAKPEGPFFRNLGLN